MKKILICLLTVLCLISCNNPATYKISGDVVNLNLNGQTLTIFERIDGQNITIDTIVVEDAKFTLSGNCDSAKVVYLTGHYPSGTPFTSPFILENGKINVTIDSVLITFGGTKENELLQRYNDEIKAFQTEVRAYFESQEIEGTQKSQEFLEQKYAEFDAKEKNINLNFARKNINTIAGLFVFARSYYYLNIEERESVFALMTNETKNNASAQKIISTTEIEKNTSTGKPFIDITLPTPEGAEFSLSALVGKTDYVLIDFWASWCMPCIRSFPELKELYNKYGTQLEILGVSLDNEKESWTNAIARYELVWKHISDLKYWNSEGAKLYGVNSIPATVLIDKEGKIVGRNLNIKEIEKIINVE